MAHRPVLGKGLASLLPGGGPMATGASHATLFHPSEENHSKDRHPGISIAQLDEIQINDYQPRHDFDESTLEELAQSIRINGIIQPLIVRKSSHGYQLIAGERRLRAAKIAGLRQVPIVIRRTTDKEALELALIENIQREDLNCVDEALAYQQLIQEFSLTQEEVANRVGKDRATVSNCLRVLKLPQKYLDDLKSRLITFGHAKAILVLDSEEQRDHLRDQILEKRLSVRQAEQLADDWKKGKSNPLESKQASPAEIGISAVKQRLNTISQDLTRHWSARVELKGNEKKGKIIIHYSSQQDLNRILQGIQSP